MFPRGSGDLRRHFEEVFIYIIKCSRCVRIEKGRKGRGHRVGWEWKGGWDLGGFGGENEQNTLYEILKELK